MPQLSRRRDKPRALASTAKRGVLAIKKRRFIDGEAPCIPDLYRERAVAATSGLPTPGQNVTRQMPLEEER